MECEKALTQCSVRVCGQEGSVKWTTMREAAAALVMERKKLGDLRTATCLINGISLVPRVHDARLDIKYHISVPSGVAIMPASILWTRG